MLAGGHECVIFARLCRMLRGPGKGCFGPSAAVDTNPRVHWVQMGLRYGQGVHTVHSLWCTIPDGVAMMKRSNGPSRPRSRVEQVAACWDREIGGKYQHASCFLFRRFKFHTGSKLNRCMDLWARQTDFWRELCSDRLSGLLS